MALTHTMTCDYKCTTSIEVTVYPTGIECPDGWESWTILTSLHPDTGLTFYRCPKTVQETSPGEFLRYVMDENDATNNPEEDL